MEHLWDALKAPTFSVPNCFIEIPGAEKSTFIRVPCKSARLEQHFDIVRKIKVSGMNICQDDHVQLKNFFYQK